MSRVCYPSFTRSALLWPLCFGPPTESRWHRRLAPGLDLPKGKAQLMCMTGGIAIKWQLWKGNWGFKDPWILREPHFQTNPNSQWFTFLVLFVVFASTCLSTRSLGGWKHPFETWSFYLPKHSQNSTCRSQERITIVWIPFKGVPTVQTSIYYYDLLYARQKLT